ncbi:DUF262 domain-containing protein [Microbacterium sp. KUDC0406]|uniref:DUF262 domain-containing protein n=1 Tax=Microbacterium sp. KUDC0406 TaxID=2909588 RepID=UPI001F26DF47|nr:DUF262 domain-containing protein [Microbacterium sp. KUDC0406]UJP11124.1 DUF262 domain-containing protein [Microbacterium sp. KUDC0406]
MATATNVEATATSTIEWLSAPSTNIVVPVYQRQYRWDIGGCERLLSDIRAVAAEDAAHRHFIGSILSAEDASAEDADLILIDGQQRVTTLMLLVAALHHTVRDADPLMAAELERVLVRADDPSRTKLRPHHAWADLYDSVVLDRRDDADRESRFDDNYAFFRSQVHADEAPADLGGPEEARARVDHPRGRGERSADLREPELHGRATPRPRAHPQLHPDGALARRAGRDRRGVLAADRAPHRRDHRRVLAALPRHDDRPRGRGRR